MTADWETSQHKSLKAVFKRRAATNHLTTNAEPTNKTSSQTSPDAASDPTTAARKDSLNYDSAFACLRPSASSGLGIGVGDLRGFAGNYP
jgi:hypothetical protein